MYNKEWPLITIVSLALTLLLYYQAISAHEDL